MKSVTGLQPVKSKYFRLILPPLSLLFWVGIWWLGAIYVKEPLLLPAPPAVFARLLELARTAVFWKTALYSLLRILTGILFSLFSGVLLAFLTAKSAVLRTLFHPLLTVVRSTPVASFIILLLIWVQRDRVPVLIAILIVLPVIWKQTETALLSVDRNLLEMAKVFRLPFYKRLVSIYFPAVLPAIRSSAETSTGLAWKAGIAAEVLAVPLISIGRQLYDSKIYLETVDLFAWTLTVILLSLLIETVFGRIFRIPTGKLRVKFGSSEKATPQKGEDT